jgi:hypothetical protein
MIIRIKVVEWHRSTSGSKWNIRKYRIKWIIRMLSGTGHLSSGSYRVIRFTVK